ncbi:MAG: 5'-methylthioadenosine/S-adenosylhomocysteine nucleosidase [Victivallales bacterium]|nr:5'-methylthioadenosine/S-adenosylhomocysteine nucleosidase [Victivallales bacterium]
MKIGFIIPTKEEAAGVPAGCVAACGFGAGKSSNCAAAADLIFNRGCDTIVIWGTAGGLSPELQAGDVVVANRVAHKDFSLTPLPWARGLGDVPEFSEEDFWHTLDGALVEKLRMAARTVFPEHKVVIGPVCSGDIFDPAAARGNPIEAQAWAVDMETSAVAEFCHRLNTRCGMAIRFGTIRVISNNADTSNSNEAGDDFGAFLQRFAAMNARLVRLQELLESPNTVCVGL